MKTDTELRNDIQEELNGEPGLNSSEIRVAVNDGIVTLTGYVDSYAEKREAESAAKRVSGVNAVVEEMEIRLPDKDVKADRDLAEVAEDFLAWNVWVPPDRIKITVERGWITLEGRVDHYYEKEAAESALRRVRGVRGISNLVDVQPMASAKDVEAEITAALWRHATLTARAITVTASGSKVTLGGHVSCLRDREEAARVAQAAPGVSEVENLIAVRI